MIPFTDPELIRRHETTVEIELGSAADPDTVRCQLIDRAVEAILAVFGPRAAYETLAIATDVTARLHVSDTVGAATIVLPVALAFDRRDDHGEGTAGRSAEELLSAVVRHEVTRSWHRFGIERFVEDALVAGTEMEKVSRRVGRSSAERLRNVEAAELALHRIGVPPCRILCRWREFPTSP